MRVYNPDDLENVFYDVICCGRLIANKVTEEVKDSIIEYSKLHVDTHEVLIRKYKLVETQQFTIKKEDVSWVKDSVDDS